MGDPVYCNDGGSNTAPYETWAKAATAMATALGAVDAGGTIWVQSDHAESFGASQTWASTNGVAATPVTIISVKNTNEPPEAGDYETMATGGGSLATAGGNYDITLNGWDVWIGMHFNAADDFLFGAANKSLKLINCKLTVADNIVTHSNDVSTIILENVDVVQDTSGAWTIHSGFFWRGGSFSFGGGGAISVNLFSLSTSRGGDLRVEDVTFVGLDGDDYLVNASDTSKIVLIERCIIPAAVNLINTTPTGPSCEVKFHSVSSSDIIYQFQENYFTGQVNHATNCKLTGDWSAKLVSNANAIEWSQPLRFKLAEIYSAANPTVTVNVIHDQQGSGGGDDLQDDEFWIEVEYPAASAELMLGKIKSSKPATILTAASDLGNNAEGWTEDLANEVKQEAAVTIADGGAGIHTVWACVGKASATIYVDPIPVLS